MRSETAARNAFVMHPDCASGKSFCRCFSKITLLIASASSLAIPAALVSLLI